MGLISEIYNLPDVNFIDDMELEDVKEIITSTYLSAFQKITGKAAQLSPADPEKLLQDACAVLLFICMKHIDKAGKMSLLKYAYGEYLDNLAALRGVSRLPAKQAQATVRFSLGQPLGFVVSVPEGSRITEASGEYYFRTGEYAEILPGESYVDIACICETVGAGGNGFAPGALSILADVLPYIDSVENITESGGGLDVEDDESLRERVFLAPSGYSVAGAKDAYAYHAKSYSADVGSVQVSSPAPCEVVVTVLLDGGVIPSGEFLNGLAEYLSDETRRPLTDRVTVKAPDEVPYALDVKYWIRKSDSASALTIQSEVAAAVAEYVQWQCNEIGRDINPSELVRRVLDAGAKRCEVESPGFASVPADAIAALSAQSIAYGGLEDD